MPRNPESRDLARAIRRKGIDLVHAHAQRLVKAAVVQTGPLVVELMRNDITIDDDHLILGAMMRWYDQQVGFTVGDMVLLTCLDDGDWYVHDVVTQSDLSALPTLVQDPAPLSDLPEPEAA